jgi:hypothetical protein
MFKLVVVMLLALTVGWKVAVNLSDNATDDLKPLLVEFLAHHHFVVSDSDGMTMLKAVEGDCRLLIARADPRGSNHDIIQDIASADDRVFFVYNRAVYTSLPTWSIVADEYWSRFLRKMKLKPNAHNPIIAVIESAGCKADRLPWHDFWPSA